MDNKNERAWPHSSLALALAAAAGTGQRAHAQEEVFDLGRMTVITVIGEVQDADPTDNKVTIEDIWRFDRNTLDDAIKQHA